MTTTPVTPTDPPPPIPLDERPIAGMYFSGGDETRAILQQCHVSKAFEIELLGCTGAAGFGLSIGEITKLRLGLGGGGVGLPCFIPPDRFCLAHNTIGGLQRDQEQRNPENAAAISRELTPKEAGHVALTEAVRHTGKGGTGEQMAAAQGAFSGYGDMPRGVEMVEDPVEAAATMHREDAESAEDFRRRLFSKIRTPVFTCPEHDKTNWSCRFCVAQAIVEGELDTTFAVCGIPEARPFTPINDASTGITGAELDAEIEAHDKAGAETVLVYALATTYKRKLSR